MQQSQPQVLYTPEQRAKRDATRWTLVQGVLAPVQFLVFLISLYWVVTSLRTGEHTDWALASVVIKTVVLYAIMITGSIWEKVVFGKYLFAKAFFWEDVVSMGVIVLHTVYIISLFYPFLSLEQQMLLILSAYTAYCANAIQFVLKLRSARLQESKMKAQATQSAERSAEIMGDQPGVMA